MKFINNVSNRYITYIYYSIHLKYRLRMRLSGRVQATMCKALSSIPSTHIKR